MRRGEDLSEKIGELKVTATNGNQCFTDCANNDIEG